MTQYNKKCYRVDSIDFSQSPRSTFPRRGSGLLNAFERKKIKIFLNQVFVTHWDEFQMRRSAMRPTTGTTTTYRSKTSTSPSSSTGTVQVLPSSKLGYAVLRPNSLLFLVVLWIRIRNELLKFSMPRSKSSREKFRELQGAVEAHLRHFQLRLWLLVLLLFLH